MSWISTHSGVRFDLLEPRVEDVRIADISHALSHVCRFAGHTNAFYSVAQHSVIVSRVVDHKFALEGLLHDAAEAYVGDVTRPLKPHLLEYAAIEERIQQRIWQKYGCAPSTECLDAIKEADLVVLATEARDLIGDERSLWFELPEPLSSKIVPWECPEAARLAFQMRFVDLVVDIPAASQIRDELETLLAQVDARPLAELRDLAGSNWKRGRGIKETR